MMPEFPVVFHIDEFNDGTVCQHFIVPFQEVFMFSDLNIIHLRPCFTALSWSEIDNSYRYNQLKQLGHTSIGFH